MALKALVNVGSGHGCDGTKNVDVSNHRCGSVQTISPKIHKIRNTKLYKNARLELQYHDSGAIELNIPSFITITVPIRPQHITWTSIDIWSVEPVRTISNERVIVIQV